MVRLALCLDPQNPAATGVAQKAIRSIDPRCGRDAEDSARRADLYRKVMAERIPGSQVPLDSILPRFGERDGRPVEEQHGIMVPRLRLGRLAEKITRGIAFLDEGRYIQPPSKVSFFVISPAADADPAIADVLYKYGKLHSRGPGISVYSAVPPEDRAMAMLSIEIWGQLKLHTFVDTEGQPARPSVSTN